MSPNKDFLRGPSTRDRAKQSMIQGACVLGIGLLGTLGTLFTVGVIWLPTIVVAVVGLFWLLYGVVVFLTGFE